MLVFLASAALLTASPNVGTVAVLDFVPRGGVPADVAQTISELAVIEVRKDATGRKVISSADLAALIGYERRKQSLGCSDTLCLAEIGGALGASEIVAGSLSVLGDSYVLTMKRLDVRRASAIREGAITRPRGNDAVLAAAVQELAASLFSLSDAPFAAVPFIPPSDARSSSLAPSVVNRPPSPVNLPTTEIERPRRTPRRSHVTSIVLLSLGALFVGAAVVGTVEVAAFGSLKEQSISSTVSIARGTAAQSAAVWGGVLAFAGYPLGVAALTTGAFAW